MTDPEAIRNYAVSSEAEGWDGVMFPDNQSLWGDTYVSMTLAATVTETLLLCNASTNAGTRHPAVTASAIAAVDLVSKGRASLGIARGDSALAHLGSAPVSVAAFDAYLGAVSSLLAGEAVGFGELAQWRPAKSVTELKLPHAPEASRLVWLEPAATPVPVRVFASGPKTMAAAARHGDQVFFGLGADVDRIEWGVSTVRRLCAEAGRDPDEITFGALMSVAVCDDIALARSLVANIVASSARFSSMHGNVAGPVSDAEREIYEGVAAGYDMTAHGESGNQIGALTAEFIDEFALVGSADRCADRLERIAQLGISDALLMVPRNDTAALGVSASRAVVEELLPRVHALR